MCLLGLLFLVWNSLGRNLCLETACQSQKWNLELTKTNCEQARWEKRMWSFPKILATPSYHPNFMAFSCIFPYHLINQLLGYPPPDYGNLRVVPPPSFAARQWRHALGDQRGVCAGAVPSAASQRYRRPAFRYKQCLQGGAPYPDAPCMVYLPTFGWFFG